MYPKLACPRVAKQCSVRNMTRLHRGGFLALVCVCRCVSVMTSLLHIDYRLAWGGLYAPHEHVHLRCECDGIICAHADVDLCGMVLGGLFICMSGMHMRTHARYVLPVRMHHA